MTTQRPSAPRCWNELDEAESLAGVEAVERLVGDHDGRAVDQRLCHLDPLTHALRIGVDRARVVGIHLDGCQRRPRRRVGVLDPLEHGRQSDELDGPETGKHPLLLRHEPDVTQHADVSRRGSRPNNLTWPMSGAVRPHSIRNSVDFPAPLGPSNAVTPGPTSNDTSDTATRPLNHLLTLRTAIGETAIGGTSTAAGALTWSPRPGGTGPR